MKKALLIFLLVIPVLALGAFTEFYCDPVNGSNLNPGTIDGSSANGSGTNDYTTSGGNWTNSTRVFTVTDGTNPSTKIAANDFCSVYVTSGATQTTFVGRVSAVQNANNGTVTFSTAFTGTNPNNGTGTMTLKHGGAWLGMNAASTFPLTLSQLSTATNTSSDQVRVNLLTTASYSLTSVSLTFNATAITVQGYSSTVGDGGKATITNSATGGSGATQFTLSGVSTTWTDIIWNNTGASNQASLVTITGAGQEFIRNVFRNARAQGTVSSGTPETYYECEWYGNNVANGSATGGFYNNAGVAVIISGNSHDNLNGAAGYYAASGSLYLFDSISDTNPGAGTEFKTNSSGGTFVSKNSDDYNNTGDAIKDSSTFVGSGVLLINNNLIKNGGKGINIVTAGQSGYTYNNGYGSGTQANGSTDVLKSVVDTGTSITYASGVTPYNGPTTGDFSNVLAAAQGVGRGHFEENDGANTGTVGYPDVGAAQAHVGCPYPTPTSTPTNTPTPTATATASFTPCAATPTATATSTPTNTPTPTASATATATPRTVSHIFVK